MPSVMEIVKFVAPKLKIKASTLSQINSPIKAKYYENLGIRRIVVDEDIYRRFDILKNIRKVYTGDIEVILNSYCVNDCPFKMFHFNNFSHSNQDKDIYSYFGTRCMAIHLEVENYMKLNWIRPEDIHYYYAIDINYFKLQGRTNVYTGDPAKSVIYYIEEHYDGDLISLIELFSYTKPFTNYGVTINNRKLDGFFDKFVKDPTSCTKVCDQCGYCNTYSLKSITVPDKLFTDNQIASIILSEFPETLKNE